MKQKSVEIFIPGPSGRLEGKYFKNSKNKFSSSYNFTTSSTIWWNNE